MGSVDRCDATLPLNEMMFYVRKSKQLRERWNTDLAGLCREFGVSQIEYEALRDRDVKTLHELGVHQYYVPQMLRLFYGASMNSNAHPALEAYKRAYPEESARALELAQRLEREGAVAEGPDSLGARSAGGLGGR
jgi:Aromatic-ring-opening dioxygenase LigAB, LigA subunit